MSCYECIVPLCESTFVTTPNKLFKIVPENKTIRNKWLTLAGRDPTKINSSATIYICEDHFDLPKDMTNYMQYKIMGTVTKMLLKPGCVPSKFDCLPNCMKKESRPNILKRRKKNIKKEPIDINKSEKELSLNTKDSEIILGL